MKTGLSLTDMAAELTRRQATKKDYIADTRQTAMTVSSAPFVTGGKDEVRLVVKNGADHVLGITPHAHSQLASRLQIPAVYYQRMLANEPKLLADNVNHWFQANPERRMVRTLDGAARAYLSDRYRRLDNLDLAEATLPVLAEQPDMRIESSEITSTKFYLKALFPKIEGEITKGDAVQAGLVISNSEVGDGSLAVRPLVYRLVCSNGMIRADESMRRYHVGKKGEDETHFADDTRKAADKAFWLTVRDSVRAAMTQAVFDAAVKRMREATTGERVADPVKAVEVLAETIDLRDEEKVSVLSFLTLGGDLSRYGMLNAVTRASQDVKDYDRATELELAGGKVLDLSPSQWHVVATA